MFSYFQLTDFLEHEKREEGGIDEAKTGKKELHGKVEQGKREQVRLKKGTGKMEQVMLKKILKELVMKRWKGIWRV